MKTNIGTTGNFTPNGKTQIRGFIKMPVNTNFEASQDSWIDLKYTLFFAEDVQLSGKAPFVKFEWLLQELPPNNHKRKS